MIGNNDVKYVSLFLIQSRDSAEWAFLKMRNKFFPIVNIISGKACIELRIIHFCAVNRDPIIYSEHLFRTQKLAWSIKEFTQFDRSSFGNLVTFPREFSQFYFGFLAFSVVQPTIFMVSQINNEFFHDLEHTVSRKFSPIARVSSGFNESSKRKDRDT